MRSLLGRSVVAAVGGILLAVLVAGVAVELLASRDLHHALDRSLRERAVEVAQLSASAPALLTQPGALDSTLGGTQLSVEVLDSDGRLIGRSLSLGGRILPAGELSATVIATGRPRYGYVTSDGERLRVYVAPLASFGGAAAGGAVVVAASRHDVAHTLANLRLFLVLAGIAAAALAAIAVYLLQRRALRPITRLAAAAAEVERTGDPRRRLPLPPSNDEVGRLANTLNEMLASLERARDRERRFLADASHELRTPLTALRGNIAYLARHGATPELLTDLEHDAERLARLADDLLALAREESSALPDADVHLDVIARDAAERHPGIELDVPEPVTIRGEPRSLERALDNLLENARVHGPEGGTVALSVERNGDLARVTVSDAGEGLRVEEKQLAFQRFWRRESGGPGSGLGLAIVRATAERHGGRAYADGARFTIELPLSGTSHGRAATTGEETEKGRT